MSPVVVLKSSQKKNLQILQGVKWLHMLSDALQYPQLLLWKPSQKTTWVIFKVLNDGTRYVKPLNVLKCFFEKLVR